MPAGVQVIQRMRQTWAGIRKESDRQTDVYLMPWVEGSPMSMSWHHLSCPLPDSEPVTDCAYVCLCLSCGDRETGRDPRDNEGGDHDDDGGGRDSHVSLFSPDSQAVKREGGLTCRTMGAIPGITACTQQQQLPSFGGEEMMSARFASRTPEGVPDLISLCIMRRG